MCLWESNLVGLKGSSYVKDKNKADEAPIKAGLLADFGQKQNHL